MLVECGRRTFTRIKVRDVTSVAKHTEIFVIYTGHNEEDKKRTQNFDRETTYMIILGFVSNGGVEPSSYLYFSIESTREPFVNYK